MTDKEDALQEIVAISRRHNVTLVEITKALTNATPPAAKPPSSILSKLFGYIGGILVFSGICIFVSMFWDDFGSAARVIITLGTGYILFLMALATLTDKRYEQASTPLFLMSSFLQPGGVFVMLDEYASGGNPSHGVLFMAFMMLAQHGAALISRPRTVLAFTSIVFGSILFTTLFDLWEMDGNLIGTVIGTSLMCLAYALGQSRHTAISPFWFFIGSITLLWSVFDVVEDTPFELTFLGISAFMIFLSTHARSRTLLLVSTLAMIGYISYFTAEHFANTLGWPLSLIIGGLALIGLSSLAVRINNKYIKKT